MATPISRRIGTPRWPRCSRRGERAQWGKRKGLPSGDWQELWGGEGGGEKGNPNKKTHGKTQHIVLWPELPLGRLGPLAKLVSQDSARPMARDRGQLEATPTPRRTMWWKTMWKEPPNASAGSSGAWTRQKALLGTPEPPQEQVFCPRGSSRAHVALRRTGVGVTQSGSKLFQWETTS